MNSKKGESKGHKADNELFVVGVGASAGGFQALDAFFSSAPLDSVAYVIVQHLSSEHKSLLRELLSQHSVLEIVEAQQDVRVVPNKVFIIPSDKELTIRDNTLQLRNKTNAARTKTIDTFFKSLAADKRRHAIGIILSGTGDDGAEGVKSIKRAGGMVLVQEPETARFDAMPRNAIDTGSADFVLAPELMHREVFNYVKVAPIADEMTDLVNNDTESSFFQILDLVHEHSGIDFSNYKRPTIIRRISRRIAITESGNLINYMDYLHLHPEEIEILSKEFLIGVTQFFRDAEAYEALATTVIPKLIDGKKVSNQLRIWVAGCSSGEEAYSLAILVREYMNKVKKDLEVKIFASDIDREALDFAGKGLYTASSLSQVSEDRLSKFFVKEEGKYRVSQRIRRMVIFAPHNVANDPPFSRIDLVSCRNMLIYLNPELQKKVIEKFHYALREGGFLFLGSSESLGEVKGFAEVNKKWKIFRNEEPAQLLGMDSFASAGLSRSSMPLQNVPSFTRDLTTKQALHQSFNELLNEIILDEYNFAAVYIDENYDVLHGAGKFKNYLDLPEQTFTFNLLKLVPPDLARHLNPMLRKAVREKEKVSAQGIQVRDGNNLRHINVVVKPYLVEKKLYQRFVLVLFSDEQPRIPLEAGQHALEPDKLQDERVHELEVELQQTKEDLRVVVEELETANEELQSTNEELLSSNEELQSTNEELQSLNEELHTINAEHQYKIKALVELDDDLNNYFRSTNIGQIFVDTELIIRKYTPAATQLINLIESDIGRSIYQISNNLRYDELVEDIHSVITTTHVVQKEVQDKKGVWYQMRIMPYITQDRKIDGAIVIFIQINELKNLQLLHSGILDSSPNAIVALKAVRNEANAISDFKLSIVNYKAQELFGNHESNILGKSLRKTYPALLEQGMFEKLVQVVHTGAMLDVEQHQKHADQFIWLHIVAVKFDDGLVLTLQNITERKRHEQDLKKQQEEIKASAERFRTLLEAMPHISWTNKPDGAKSSFNGYWYEYTGLSEAESADWGWTKAIHPDDVEHVLQSYMDSLKKGKVYSAQARFLRKADNHYRWHLIKDVPIRNLNGDINLWVGTATDIQDQKDAEEATIQLRLAQQREILKAILQTQETERDRISEALHNGLGQILYAAKLNLNSMSSESPDVIDIKERVDQLLSESITVTRNISFELTPSVLKEFGLKTAVEEVISRITHPSLKITIDMVSCDKRLDYTMELSLYRIIQELLNNILKHSQATEASIELTCDQSSVMLCVKDNGIGIDREELKKPKGIGLHSIQNRVDLLEGKLEVATSKNNGTRFKIDIHH
ncbi:hypothetical protein GCM10023188_05250 [Pontibacter saemangeumensis]|uniref:protein-glutamate O-methyltransferase n=1 Tax=Pontibacter saemangeumensis TaxID=1084525 RepID=A0ABP8L9T9_9BACT